MIRRPPVYFKSRDFFQNVRFQILSTDWILSSHSLLFNPNVLFQKLLIPSSVVTFFFDSWRSLFWFVVAKQRPAYVISTQIVTVVGCEAHIGLLLRSTRFYAATPAKSAKPIAPPMSLAINLALHIQYVFHVEDYCWVCLERRTTGIGPVWPEKHHVFCANTSFLMTCVTVCPFSPFFLLLSACEYHQEQLCAIKWATSAVRVSIFPVSLSLLRAFLVAAPFSRGSFCARGQSSLIKNICHDGFHNKFKSIIIFRSV